MFDFDTLITDRTEDDVAVLSALLKKPLAAWTKEELAAFSGGAMKGGYGWADLNRVTACMEYLDEALRAIGYESGYRPVNIQRTQLLDPHIWYVSDVPTPGQMEQYLANVASLRSVLALPEGSPRVPDSMAAFGVSRANDIETILRLIEEAAQRMVRIINLGWALGLADIGLYGGI